MVSELSINPKFKKTTLAEMQLGPDELEVKPIVRSYVESLATVHSKFRAATNAKVDNFARLISELKQRVVTAFPGVSEPGFAIMSVDDEGSKVGEETNLSKTLDDYLKLLRSRNRHLENFARRRIIY